MHEGAVSALLGVARHPERSAESTMVARDAAIAGYEDGRVHIQHLSCAASVEAVARGEGARLCGSAREATPHHLLLTDEAVRGLDTRMKMNPPLRTEADRQALIDGLRSGTIDCVATDHAPHARDEKEVPFEQAPMGTTGLETAFAALYTELVLPGVLALALLVERMTRRRRAVRPADAARSRVGEPANVALVDLDASWVGRRATAARAARRTAASRAASCSGRVLLTRRRRRRRLPRARVRVSSAPELGLAA